MSLVKIEVQQLTTWQQLVEATNYLMNWPTGSWVFRGHEDASWKLQTSLEREFGKQGDEIEQALVLHFVRSAPRFLASHLVPEDRDVAAWLGLIQHYGGPTRLLDATRSPYVGLFFAFEPAGDVERALWAVDSRWCMFSCAWTMGLAEGKSEEEMKERMLGFQSEIVNSLFIRNPALHHPKFKGFKPFSGVFPLEPWKPDVRQSAQQAVFLCTANPQLTFLENLESHVSSAVTVVYKFELPASLREEALEKLSFMNVTAATLFPDLTGLARSLRTYTVRPQKTKPGSAPWTDKG